MTQDTVDVGRYKIALTAPLSFLDMPHAKAYKVTTNGDPEGMYYALLCAAHPIVRFAMAEAFVEKKIKGLQELLAAEPVFIGGALPGMPSNSGGHAFALIYRQPKGVRVVSLGKKVCEPLSQPELKIIIESAGLLLETLAEEKLTHRAIRPDNIYWANAAKSAVIFGDCLSVPPGYDQPPVFEPLPRSMCVPAGRGEGDAQSDLFALGVTLFSLAVGEIPLSGMTDAQALLFRLEGGDYAAYSRGKMVPRYIFDLIMGLLIEESENRWSLRDVKRWLINKSRLPKPPRPVIKSSKPLRMGKEEILTARSLNVAIRNNWEAAFDVVHAENFQYWLRQDLQDLELLEKFNELFRATQTIDKNDRLGRSAFTAQVCLILNPRSALHWENFSVMSDGIGHLLADYLIRDLDPTPIKELIMAKIPYFWVSLQEELPENAKELVRTLEKTRMIILRTIPGAGIERAVYMLAPGTPCVSKIVRSDFILQPTALLGSLEKVAPKPGEDKDILDVNLMGYLNANFPFVTEKDLAMLLQKDNKLRGLAKLTLLSTLQRQTGPKKTQNLANWLAPIVRPCIEAYHNVQLKEQLYREFDSTVPTGDLTKMLMIIDNNVAIEKDRFRFKKAAKDYQTARFEIDQLIQQLQSRDYIIGQGREISGKIVGTVAFLFALVYVLISYVFME